MNLATFKQKRLEALSQLPVFRQICGTCRQPDFSCFCAWLKPFDPRMDFIILTHPIEQQRRIATGRMSHLSLMNSKIIFGCNYTGNRELDGILADPARYCVMLYPGRLSKNITPLSMNERRSLFPGGKRLTVLVIDGTWNTAQKTVFRSENIYPLPRVCFTPTTPSNFRVRKQPRPECCSTIEAIHHFVDLLGPAFGLDEVNRPHDQLLNVFDNMVNRQLELAHSGLPSRRKYY